MTPADRVRLSVINRAGQEIDEYFTQHPEEFAHNAEGKLKDYIREMGGIEALATQLRVSIERERSRKRREEPETDTAKQMQNALAKRALDALKSSTGIGVAKMQGPVRLGAEGLTVFLGRKGKNSRDFTILASSNDPAHIEAVAASTAAQELSNLPSNLRTIVEIVRTQLFPFRSLPASPTERAKWLRTHYYEESDLWEEDLISVVPD